MSGICVIAFTMSDEVFTTVTPTFNRLLTKVASRLYGFEKGTVEYEDVKDEFAVFFGGYAQGLTNEFVEGFRSGKFGLEASPDAFKGSLERIRSGEAGVVAQKAATALDVMTLWQINTRSVSAITGLASRPYHDLALLQEGLRIAKTQQKLVGDQARK